MRTITKDITPYYAKITVTFDEEGILPITDIYPTIPAFRQNAMTQVPAMFAACKIDPPTAEEMNMIQTWINETN